MPLLQLRDDRRSACARRAAGCPGSSRDCRSSRPGARSGSAALPPPARAFMPHTRRVEQHLQQRLLLLVAARRRERERSCCSGPTTSVGLSVTRGRLPPASSFGWPAHQQEALRALGQRDAGVAGDHRRQPRARRRDRNRDAVLIDRVHARGVLAPAARRRSCSARCPSRTDASADWPPILPGRKSSEASLRDQLAPLRAVLLREQALRRDLHELRDRRNRCRGRHRPASALPPACGCSPRS